MTGFYTNGEVENGAALTAAAAATPTPEPDPIAAIDATKVPAARRVVFEGGKRVVSFEGSIRKVSF